MFKYSNMKKGVMKRGGKGTVVVRVTSARIVALFLLVFLLLGVRELVTSPSFTGAIVLPPSGNLSCQFVELANASCPGGFTKIYALSAQENAHVELPNESNYNVSVCCQDLAAANQIGIGSDGTGVINISNFTNAHAETPISATYEVPVYINASNASIGCSINSTGEGTCPTGFACMGTLSNDTNAHVSNCTSAGRYNITVCCSIGALITVYRHPNTAPTNNLTANGSINGTLVDTVETSYETQDILFFNASDNDKRFLFIRGQFNLSTVDARTLVVEYNQSALAVNTTGLSGDTDNHTLYLANNSNNLGVHVCPSAMSLLEISAGCAGETNFTGPFPQTLSGMTVLGDGSDFRIENIVGSGVELLVAINTSLTNTNLTNSTAQNSTLSDTSASNSSIIGSTKVNVTMINSTNIDSNISFAIEIDTVLTQVNASNCRFEQTTISQSLCNDSIMILDTGAGWLVDPSNVTNSSCTGVCNVTDSNVSHSTLNNGNANNSNVTTSNLTNSVVHNSTIEMSNIVGLQVFNANITNQFCFYGTIIQGAITYNCPIALSTIYNPPGGSGGGSGGAAGAAAGAAAAAASTSSTASAAAAASTSTQSLSVQAALSTTGLGQCQTVVPKVTSERPTIPRGFTLLGKPDFTCFGSVADFTINVPDQYSDLLALRCRGGVCSEVEQTKSAYQDVLCGNSTVRDLRKEEAESSRPIVTVEVPIAIEGDRYFSESNPHSIIGPYEVTIDGRLPPRFVGKLHLATGEVPLPPNPQVILLNPPLQVSLDGAHVTVLLNISVPTVTGVDLGTLSVAVYQNKQWFLLGGEFDNATGVVRLPIEAAEQYADDGVVTFGLLGVVCEACTRAELVRDYTDGSSRRAIILVHGLTAHALKFGTLIDDFRLNSQPWQVWTFRYPYDRTIEENAKELRDLIALHNEEFDEIYVLGHSLGGLIGQQALWDAYQERQSGIPVPWLAEVKRAVIVGTPNKGSPTADVYRNLLSNLFNLSSTASPYDSESSIIGDLAEGRSIQPVPGIDYQVIVGTQTIPFTQNLFGDEANDGVLTPESGSTLGTTRYHDACENYYAINITHVDLDDHPTAIRVIQRIINADLAERNPNIPLLGYNQYLRVRVDDCNPSDSYFIVGKEIPEEATFDPLLCECGNKFCNAGETPENCPGDCARISFLTQSCVGILFTAYPLILLVGLLLLWRFARRVLKRERGRVSKHALWAAAGVLTVVAIVQPVSCGSMHEVIALAALAFLLLTLLDALPLRRSAPQFESHVSSEVVRPELHDVEMIRGLSPKARALLRKRLGKNVPPDVRDALEGKKEEKAVAVKEVPRNQPKVVEAKSKRITKDELQTTIYKLPTTNYQPPTPTFSERLELLRLSIKKKLSRRKEQQRLARLASEMGASTTTDSVQAIIDNLPNEVKRKLGKRKK